MLLALSACSTKKHDEPAPAAAPEPVRLYTEDEIKTFQSALDVRLQATKARHCTRPLLRGTAVPSSAHDALVELALPHGPFGECLQRYTSAKATNADMPVFLALDRECGDEVEAAIIAAVSHDDACSPYQVGIGVLPETLAPILRSADAIGTRARARAKTDPAGAIALVADAIRAYQDLGRGQTNLIVAMISVAAEKTLLGHAHAILDGSHLTAPQLTALAATFDALLASEPPFGDTMLGEADSFELFLGYARVMPADWTPPGGWDQGLRTLESPDLGTKTDPRDYAALMMEWSELRHKNLATSCPSAGTLATCYAGLGDIATRTAALMPLDPNKLTAEMIALAGSGDAASLDATRHHLRESLIIVLERVAAASFQQYAAKRALPIAQLASARIELEVLRLGHCPNAATLNPLLTPAALGEPLVAAINGKGAGAQLSITPPAWVGDTTPWLVPCP